MIKIICIGKLKEDYLIKLVNDYLYRINKYHKTQIIELKDSTLDEEERLILKNINNKDYIITLDIRGKKYDSIEFSNKIETLLNNGESNITFIIGSSCGISENVLKLSNERISFSDLTFPHGLFRGMLLEQIYRSFKIINNETYHK
jgi:23S rRNA (pseudouridine1915-N3)-methyltransferase